MSAKPRSARALWYVGDSRAELREEPLPALGDGDALVRMLYSGVSRGTERLVFRALVPSSEYERMRGPNMGGAFPHPVKYGYQAVGIVEEGPAELLGRAVFALHPHQERFVLPAAALTLLPQDLPPRRAVLSANMETALNALWDSGAGPGDRIAVVGGGVVGCLIAALAGALPGADVTLIDPVPARAEIAAALGIAYAAPRRDQRTATSCSTPAPTTGVSRRRWRWRASRARWSRSPGSATATSRCRWGGASTADG